MKQVLDEYTEVTIPRILFIYLFIYYYYYYYYYYYVSLGLYLRHTEVPRLGVQSNQSCWPMAQTQKCGIRAASVTYTTAHSNARSLTHGVRPGIEPTS